MISNEMKIESNCCVDKDLQRRGRGLFKGIMSVFGLKTEESFENLMHDSRQTSWVPPAHPFEYNIVTMPLDNLLMKWTALYDKQQSHVRCNLFQQQVAFD